MASDQHIWFFEVVLKQKAENKEKGEGGQGGPSIILTLGQTFFPKVHPDI